MSCTTVHPADAPSNGRDAQGRFTRGNAGGPGNPFARQVAEFRRAAVAAASPEKIAAVLAALQAKALEGDVAAAKVYLAYTIGRPAAAVDPDTLNLQESRQIQQEVALANAVCRAVTVPLLETLMEMAQATRPEITKAFMRELREGLAEMDEDDRTTDAMKEDEGGEAPPSSNEDDGRPEPAPVRESAAAASDAATNDGTRQAPRQGWYSVAPPMANGDDGGGKRLLAPDGTPLWPAERWLPPWEARPTRHPGEGPP